MFYRRHPLASLRDLLILGLETAASGALGAVLVWGPLGAGRSLWTLLGGLTPALLFGSLRLRQQAALHRAPSEEARHRARRWGQRLTLVHTAIGAAVAAVALVQLQQLALLPPLSQDRLTNFDRLWRALDRHYPYFDQKQVDWEAIYQTYRPRAAAARAPAEYDQVLRTMLAELHDAHTGLVAPRPADAPQVVGLVAEMEGQPVVTRVSSRLNIPGLAPGAVILSRDGRSPQAFMADLPAWRVVGSTERQVRFKAFNQLLALEPGTPTTLTFVDPTGEVRRATLTWPPPDSSSAPTSDPLITGRRLPSGLGLIRIPTFRGQTGHNLVAEFDAALDALMDAPGLILDIRGNGGGNSRLADAMAGRLVDQPVRYGYERFRRATILRGWARRYDWWLRPRGRTYRGPVVILIDTANLSTAETFIVSLRDTGRARTVGRPTSGGSGSPVTVSLPGGRRVRYSIADFRRLNGVSVEGNGIHPDVPVVWRIADVRAGRDPDLAAAERLLLGADS